MLNRGQQKPKRFQKKKKKTGVDLAYHNRFNRVRTLVEQKAGHSIWVIQNIWSNYNLNPCFAVECSFHMLNQSSISQRFQSSQLVPISESQPLSGVNDEAIWF